MGFVPSILIGDPTGGTEHEGAVTYDDLVGIELARGGAIDVEVDGRPFDDADGGRVEAGNRVEIDGAAAAEARGVGPGTDAGEVERRARCGGPDGTEAADMGDGAGQGVIPGDGTDDAAVVDAHAGAAGAQGDVVRQGDATGEVQRAGRGLAGIKVRGDRHRDRIRSHAAESVGVGDEDDAALDGGRTQPAGIIGRHGQHAVIELLQRGAGGGADVESGIEREGLARIDLDDAGGRRVAEADLATPDREGQVLGDAQGGRSARRVEDDLVGGRSQLAVGRDGEDAAVDDHVAGEVIRGVAEREGTVAGLGESVGSADLTVDTQAGREHRLGRVGHLVGDARGGREGVGDDESVTIEVGDDEAEIQVRDRGSLDGLVRGLTVRQGPAGAVDDDVRHDAFVEDDGAREDDGLRDRVTYRTVVQEGDGRGISERGGVEVAEVTLGVEDEGSEAGLVEGRDVGDVRDDAAQGDGDPRTGDIDLRRTVGQSGDRAIERKRTRSAGITGVEERDAGEADGVADGEITLAHEQAGAGGHADRAGAERTTKNTIATLDGGAARADDEAARADGEAAGELVLAGELEQAVAGLGDRDARARNDRGDVEGREDVRNRRRDARDLDGVDVEDLGPGGQDDASVGDFGDDVRIIRGGREGRGAAQRQERVDPDVEVGELGAGELAATVVEGDRGEFVDGVLGEGETTAAVDGDGIGGRDGPGGVDIDGREVLTAPTAVEDDAAGGDDHGGRARRVDVQVAGIDDGAAGVGVGGSQDLDAGAGLDVGERRAHGGVLEDGVEDDVRSAERIGGDIVGGRRSRAQLDGVVDGIDRLDIGAGDDARTEGQGLSVLGRGGVGGKDKSRGISDT